MTLRPECGVGKNCNEFSNKLVNLLIGVLDFEIGSCYVILSRNLKVFFLVIVMLLSLDLKVIGTENIFFKSITTA